MNLSTVIIIIDLLLWLIIAANVAYVLFFALASLLPKKKNSPFTLHPSPFTFKVLFPAYNEDTVILHSVESFLQQDYPKDCYEVVVISDHMSPETNEQLSKLPITLLQPTFERSSKAKALQFVFHQPFLRPSGSKRAELERTLHPSPYDYVVILDADNIVQSDFLTQLNEIASPNVAIQCHRTAKNADNDIAALDGISEEINNSIFRKGHNRIGMSSALIGSGMCFDYQWFKENVNLLDSAVEDRELEALLMKQGIYIHYAGNIHVLDEKVSNSDTFQRQRLRWMTGQVQVFFRMLPYIPKAIISGNINYIDKTIQQALIPRSILLVLTPLFAFLSLITHPLGSAAWLVQDLSFITHHSSLITYKWFVLLIALVIAILIAIPKPLRTKALFSKVLSLPSLAWKMFINIMRIDRKNTYFIHTTHEK